MTATVSAERPGPADAGPGRRVGRLSDLTTRLPRGRSLGGMMGKPIFWVLIVVVHPRSLR